MNCISINVRGIGADYKVEWVRRLKTQHRASFVGIQETQLVNVNDRDVAGCWGSIDFSYSAIQSQGRSGGLVSIWDSRIFKVSEIIKSRYLLATIGRWEGIQGDTILVNVYGPHSSIEKKKLWEELLQIKRDRGGT